MKRTKLTALAMASELSSTSESEDSKPIKNYYSDLPDMEYRDPTQGKGRYKQPPKKKKKRIKRKRTHRKK